MSDFFRDLFKPTPVDIATAAMYQDVLRECEYWDRRRAEVGWRQADAEFRDWVRLRKAAEGF
jgi:hypothetical protein